MSKSHWFLATSFAAALLMSGQATAHAQLSASVPTDGATVATSPTEIDLHFSEELNLKFSGIKIIGADKAEAKTGNAKLTDSGKKLVVPVSAALPAGTYTVEWHVLSTDGHKTSGSYSFNVKP
ncbi:copper homeostasis periplasmic binding protein CopC [Rhizobium sp. S96]|uniref:copper homeostasis periplasmic binding protein CopC n=1 Tax=Rhizobium sp. S96 TaxID=3055140 RepID=UPI0025AAA113|nr:copper homeostasis periplasmic binding protein CopC [Rhizobium sp. S96]MDM9620631.1 copper homeostasis periplasmic binding protein CopC [Rhizobium sp. S96]